MSLAVCARTKHQRQREGRHICYVRLQNRILLLGLFSVDCTFVIIWHGHIWVCKRWISQCQRLSTSPCLWLYCLFSPMSRRTTHKPLPDFNCNKRLILAVCMILLILVVTCCQAPPPPFFCSKHFILQHVFTKSRAPRILNCNDSINTEK